MKFRISIIGLMALLICVSSCGRRNNECEPWQYDVMNEDYVHTYGVQVAPDDWVERGQNGQVVCRLRNGTLVTKNFKDGYLDGDTTYTFPHSGAIQKVETYSNGLMITERENHLSGAPCLETEHHSLLSKTIRTWYENGAPKSREMYEEGRLLEADYYTMNNQVESRIIEGRGSRVIRDEFGQLAQVDNFENGEMVLSTTYFPNGSPKEETPYNNGKIEGHRKVFFPGGDPRAIEAWSNGRQEGVTILFYNGEKTSELPYFNGLKNGIEQRFKEGNLIVEEITWKHDRKHGPSYYYLGGDNVRVDWYLEGRLVPKSQYDRYVGPPR